MNGDRPIEVAIVGGGCGGIAAAFELSRPEHRGKYRVTVYQVGWRLGGKGASGRGPADRIEEHGLHIWLGFYENAFRLMRECYAELDRDPETCRIADWRDAFHPDPHVSVADPSPGGEWLNWGAYFPPTAGLPGDPLSEHNPFTLQAYLVRSAQLLRVLLGAVRTRESSGETGGEAADERGGEPAAGISPKEVLDLLARLARYGALATMAGLTQALGLLEMVLRALPSFPAEVPLRLIDAVWEGARRLFEGATEGDDETRRLWEIIDLVLAILRGLFRFGVVTDPRGFDALDDYECREWLLLAGASKRSVDSAFVRGLYDLALAYEGGDPDRPVLAAGQALRGAARMFYTYRGALFWKMSSGMGDVVFAPFYEVLKKRGVRFEFFHRLENVRLAPEESLAPGERPYVEALELDVQARVAGGGEYEPLVPVRDLPCWPSQPDWSQLEDGERMEREGWELESFWDRRKVGTRTLRVSEDFDFVVLAVGLGAVPHVAKELVERDPRWKAMVEKVKTVATQAFQVWMREDMEDLGWSDPPTTISGFVQPFDTWADMRQLVTEESFPDEPRSIAYFCSVLPDPETPPERSDAGYPAARAEEVRANAVRFLDRDIRHLWPKAVRRPEGGFRWEVLVDPEGGEPPAEAGEERFATQYWRANVNPSDRYVLCPPGTPKYRISPLDNTYDNLTVAGDWTSCGFNEGCVEAAVMAGRLAAHALSHSPPLEEIVGYDHP